MPASDSDGKKRDGSLPPGCKDLIDVIRSPPKPKPAPLPPIKRQVTLPPEVSVRYLAELLGAESEAFLAEMREMGISAEWCRSMRFDQAQRLLRRHGIWATRAA